MPMEPIIICNQDKLKQLLNFIQEEIGRSRAFVDSAP
jgi:hypothetical protein